MLRASKSLASVSRASWKRLFYSSTSSASSSSKYVDYDPVTKMKFKPAITADEDEENGKNDGDDYGDNVKIKRTDEDSDQYFAMDESTAMRASKKIILKLGKTHNRHVEYLPNWFVEKQKDICQHRTVPQIRRCLKNWMIKHDHDVMMEYSVRKIGFRNEHNLPITSSKKIPKTYVYGPEETIAYAFYHMPSRFSIYQRLLHEMHTFLPTYEPSRVLDFGCGPATFAAAMKDSYPNVPVQYYRGIDLSQSMIDAAKIMTKEILPNATFYTQTGDFLKRFQAFPNERYSCVTMNYTLSELSSDEMKKTMLQMAWELVEPNGVLMIVESGNPQGSNIVRSARQFILDMSQTMDEKGKFKVYAPIGPAKHNPTFSSSSSPTSETFLDGETKITIEELGGEPAPITGKRSRYGGKEDGEYMWTEGMVMFPLPTVPTGATSSEHSPSSPKQGRISPSTGKQPIGQYNDYEAAVIAPCTHDRVCPLKTGIWCSFTQKVVSGTMRKDAEERYSYVIIQKLVKPSKTKQPQLLMDGRDEQTESLMDGWVVAGQKNKVYTRFTPLDIMQILDTLPSQDEEEDAEDAEDAEEDEEEERKGLAALDARFKEQFIKKEHESLTTKKQSKKGTKELDEYFDSKEAVEEAEDDSSSNSSDSSNSDGSSDDSSGSSSESSSDKDGGELLIPRMSPLQLIRAANPQFSLLAQTPFPSSSSTSSTTIPTKSSKSSKHPPPEIKEEEVVTQHSMSGRRRRLPLRSPQDIALDNAADEAEDEDEEEEEVDWRTSPETVYGHFLEQCNWEEYDPILHREEYGRVIRAPIKASGHVLMDICASNGTILRYTQTPSMPTYLPRLYPAVRKVTWGGLLPLFMFPEPSEYKLQTTTTTSLEHEKAKKGVRKYSQPGLKQNTVFSNLGIEPVTSTHHTSSSSSTSTSSGSTSSGGTSSGNSGGGGNNSTTKGGIVREIAGKLKVHSSSTNGDEKVHRMKKWWGKQGEEEESAERGETVYGWDRVDKQHVKKVSSTHKTVQHPPQSVQQSQQLQLQPQQKAVRKPVSEVVGDRRIQSSATPKVVVEQEEDTGGRGRVVGGRRRAAGVARRGRSARSQEDDE